MRIKNGVQYQFCKKIWSKVYTGQKQKMYLSCHRVISAHTLYLNALLKPCVPTGSAFTKQLNHGALQQKHTGTRWDRARRGGRAGEWPARVRLLLSLLSGCHYAHNVPLWFHALRQWTMGSKCEPKSTSLPSSSSAGHFVPGMRKWQGMLT